MKKQQKSLTSARDFHSGQNKLPILRTRETDCNYFIRDELVTIL